MTYFRFLLIIPIIISIGYNVAQADEHQDIDTACEIIINAYEGK